MPKISVLVSLFNSERFLPGLLSDLCQQTLYASDALEIIAIVSGSEQGEARLLTEAQKTVRNLIVEVTPRETMYQAWNRAILGARGEYLTNANADDRHAPDGIERLLKLIESDSSIDLVYGDCYLSTTENETFEENNKSRIYRYSHYFAPDAPLYYQFGPHPLWRRSVHETIGLFSERLRGAGDYEFNLRFASWGRKARKVSGPPVGMYLAHAQALSFKDSTLFKESEALRNEYRTPTAVLTLYHSSGLVPATKEGEICALWDFGVRALHYYPAWFEGTSHSEPELALSFFDEALERDALNPALLNNRFVAATMANKETLTPRMTEAAQTFEPLRENMSLVENLRRGQPPSSLIIVPSPLGLPSEVDLSRST